MLRTQLSIVASVALARIKPTYNIFDSSSAGFVVKPWDLDLNFHLNNVRCSEYLAQALGLHFVHTRYLGHLYWKGWTTFIATTHISYVRPVALLQRFEIATVIAGCDDKYVYFEQAITARGQLATTSIQRTAIMDRERRRVAPEIALAAIAPGAPRPAAPAYARHLRDVGEAQRERAPEVRRAAQGAP